MGGNSTLRNISIKTSLILSSVLISLFLVEITLRIFFPIPYSMELEYIPDGHLGFRLEPNFVDLYDQVPHTQEFFLDRVHLTEKGNLRIAELLFEEMIANPQLDSLLQRSSHNE